MAAMLLLPAHSAAASTLTPSRPSAGMTLEEATDSFRHDLAQLGALKGELVELLSCLAVDSPPECIPDFPGLQLRLSAAAAACGRLRASAPVIGAAVAERRPGGGAGSGRLGGALERAFGRQVSPADIEYMEEVEEAAIQLDDSLIGLQGLAGDASVSFSAFSARGPELVASVNAVVLAARRMVAGAFGR